MEIKNYTLRKVDYADFFGKFEQNEILVYNNEMIKLYCPCGCGKKTDFALRGTPGNEWTIVDDNPAAPTIEPSINLSGFDCATHFMVTKGEVKELPKFTRIEASAGFRAAQG